jgi:hypothetical protein
MSANEFDDLGKQLVAELEREVQPGHELTGRKLVPIAKCGGCDDAVFRLDDETWVIVHLTWSRQAEAPPWPRTKRVGSFLAIEAALTEHEH